jgi:endonuclease/exonuclease/phosphatase family metal-dependent hydrolase
VDGGPRKRAIGLEPALRLRVITYNIHRAIGVDRRFRPERIAKILAHYRADLVLLQEVDEGAPRSRELDLARELAGVLGFPYVAVGHNVTLKKGRYGNATLSRFPILRERNIDLTIDESPAGAATLSTFSRRRQEVMTAAGGGFSLIRRGCQHTTIAVGSAGAERPVEAFNLHLGLSARERERQVGLLVNSEEFRRVGPEVPVFVAGDFNDWRSLLRPIFTEVFGFRCATDRRGPRVDRAIRTYPSFSPQGGLDRIYYRGPLDLAAVRACRLQASRVASDHLPVIAEFEVR